MVILGRALSQRFKDLGFREYDIYYEGQRGALLAEPIIIEPTPHISDLGVAELDRPNYANKQEQDNYAARNYSVKFNKDVMVELAATLAILPIRLYTRDARYGIRKNNEIELVHLKPLSEPTERLGRGHFVSLVLSPVKGAY